MTFTRCFRDHNQSSLTGPIIQNVCGRNPHDPDTLLGKPAIAAFVMRNLAGKIVMGAIYLDRELRGGTIEVQNIAADGSVASLGADLAGNPIE